MNVLYTQSVIQTEAAAKNDLAKTKDTYVGDYFQFPSDAGKDGILLNSFSYMVAKKMNMSRMRAVHIFDMYKDANGVLDRSIASGEVKKLYKA